MKRCPQCQQEYPPNVKFCPRDGTAVEEIGGEADPLLGRLLGGRYRVEKRVGSGGFGTVYRVRDQRFHDVPKALKIIHRRLAQDRIAMERFQQEAQLLFDLGKRSAAIVQFYDFEEDPQEGLFYFAMEWVEGKSLTQVLIQEEKLPLARALPIVRQLCQALQVAHRRGVIHRDLKPDNLMLVEEDGEEEIKVLDFGIAKALAGHWGEKKFTETVLGMPGTGGYAAPEQIGARSQDIGPPTDLFAVGVILYNLLTGREPWLGRRIADLGQLTRDDDLRLLNRVLDAQAIPPRQWNPELPAELERLLLKLLEKEPRNRFQSAAELDQALQQVGQPALQPPPARPAEPRPAPPPLPEPRRPVAARAATGPPLVRPLPPPARRPARKVLVGLLLAAAVLVAGALVWQWWPPTGAPPQTQPPAETIAETVPPATPTERPAEQVEPEPAPPPAAPTVEFRAEPRVIELGQTTTLSWESSNASEVRLEPGVGSVRGEGSVGVSPTEDTTYRLVAEGPGGTAETSVRVTVRRVVLDFVLERTWPEAGELLYVKEVAFSPDGRLLASANWHIIRLLDVDSGREVRTLTGHIYGVVSLVFSPDGRWLASAGADRNDKARIWEVATGRELRSFRGIEGQPILAAAFSPDGRLLAAATWHTVKLWDAATGQEVRTLTGHSGYLYAVAFSPDGRWLASAGEFGRIKLWEVATGREVHTLTGHTSPRYVHALAFSPDGRWLASGGSDQTIRLWEVATGQEVRTLRGHTDSVEDVAFSPDGRWLASGSRDHTVKLWEVATGREVRTLRGHTDDVEAVAFSPDGRWLASGSGDKTVKLWRRVEQ